MARKKRGAAEVNAGSMADIAFLLLIFFLVTTTIASDKGLAIRLPPKPDPNEPPPEVKFNERNIFKVLVNSSDAMLVQGEPMSDAGRLKEDVKAFVLNRGRNPNLSESPDKAVVSFKTDRGTGYEKFIEVYDELKGAYYEIYAEELGITADQVRSLEAEGEPSLQERYKELRSEIPMQISIAEPSKAGGN
ncbi:ExbD/TolR family protein [Catalinimonas niigatensis]|uniref:ExbD/TolR family protein n=1 Tax=Catalinimonas niigatensis TaxID=1397264 RepID=UPI002665FA5F|nr:biopolymer transporter ExbD [Catalinimonas niigatensis]WPP53194.1 biopolymer transporter ExbD [Catalinimonas niigatensis]